MNTVDQKVLAIVALMLECGVKKKDLAKLAEGIFDQAYLAERDVLVRLHNKTKTFDEINSL